MSLGVGSSFPSFALKAVNPKPLDELTIENVFY